MNNTSQGRILLGIAAAAVMAACGSGRALGQLKPEETLAALKVADGLEVTLWAAEPGVVNPTNIDIDERGRVWVAEAANYRGVTARPEGDRIMILEDTDRDGRCDSYKVFYQDPSLFAPLGVCKAGDKLYVSQSPNLLVFTIDPTGDKPTGKPEVLFTGFTGVNHDHGLHAALFGPDGRLYFNSGNEGMKGKVLLGAKGKQVVDALGSDVPRGSTWRGEPRGKRLGYQEGMAFRCDPDGRNFETLGYNFRNNYELAVDSFGTVWQSDNDDDGNEGVRINYVMEGGDFGYKGPTGNDWRRDMPVFAGQTRQEAHWHQRYPGVVPNLLHTGAGSPSGILAYEGGLLGERFRGALIHCDAGPNVVRAYLPKPSRDVPTGLMELNKVPPADRPGAGYAAEAIDLIKGGDKWFRPVDACAAPDGSVFVADWYDPGVGGHATGDRADKGGLRGRIYRLAPKGHRPAPPALDLGSVAGAVAALNSPNLATRYLGYQKLVADPRAVAPVADAFNGDRNSVFRARALWVLSRLPGGNGAVSRALGDRDENIRITAVRAARLLKQDMVQVAAKLTGDPSPGVLRELALAMNYEPTERAIPVLMQLADRYDGTDRWYLEALGIGATGREAALLDAWTKDGRNKDAKVAGALKWRLGGGEAVQRVASAGTRYVAEWSMVGPFRATAADGLKTRFASDENPGVVDLAATYPGAEGKTVKWEKVGTEAVQDARVASFSDLLNARRIDLKNAVGYFATHVASPADQEATLLIGCDDQALVWLNGREVFRSTRGGAMQIDAERVPIQLRKGNNVLLVKLFNGAGGSVLAVGIKAASGTTAVEFSPTPPAAGVAAAVATTAPAAGPEAAPAADAVRKTKDGEVLPLPEALAALDGNPARGEAVFKNTKAANCIACHQIGDEGMMYGPPLTTVGQKLSKAQLFDAILYPSNAILMGYETWVVRTKDGDVIDGLKDAETPDLLTIKDAAGKYHDIPADQVERKVMQKVSAMPEALSGTMTKQELLDLVAYLATLRNAE